MKELRFHRGRTLLVELPSDLMEEADRIKCIFFAELLDGKSGMDQDIIVDGGRLRQQHEADLPGGPQDVDRGPLILNFCNARGDGKTHNVSPGVKR